MAEEQESTEDQESKTEEPSHKRLEDALEKGQVIYSREVTSFFLLFGFTLLTIWIIPLISRSFLQGLSLFISRSGEIQVNQGYLGRLLAKLFIQVILVLSPIFIFVIAVSILSPFFQQGQLTFSSKQITPDISRISMTKGVQRLFSMKNVVEFIKSVVKIFIVGFFIYLVVRADILDLRIYHEFSVSAILAKLHSVINHTMIAVSVTMAAIALFDYMYQRYQYFNSLKMSRQELKEEYKQLEGHPEVKRKQRSLRIQKAKQRMMQSVPKADVVITNPEHYAIALEYDQQKMVAPTVTAKGLDLVAQKIRALAEKHDVPIVENPPLARILYKDVEIGSAVPEKHYKAVADIISYVYKLKNKKI